MKKIIVIGLAVVVVLIGLSVFLLKQKKAQIISTTLPKINSTVEIPKDWQKEENNNQTSFYSPETQQQKTGDITKGCKITVTASDNTEGLTTDSLSSRLEEQSKEDNIQTIGKYIKKITVDNKQAVDAYVETAEFGVVRKVYIFSGNQIKQLTLYTKEDKQMCQSQFDQMIESGKF